MGKECLVMAMGSVVLAIEVVVEQEEENSIGRVLSLICFFCKLVVCLVVVCGCLSKKRCSLRVCKSAVERNNKETHQSIHPTR